MGPDSESGVPGFPRGLSYAHPVGWQIHRGKLLSLACSFGRSSSQPEDPSPVSRGLS